MIYEVAHQIALIPLALMALFGRRLPRAYWLVALAFAVSWAGDSLAHYAGGSWAASYVWLPVQFALVLWAMRPGEAWPAALPLVASVSWVVSGPGPEWIITAAGSVAVLVLAHGRLAVPLVIYFGPGTLCYFWMTETLDHIMPAWYAYQACRLAAIAAFGFAAYRGYRGLDD